MKRLVVTLAVLAAYPLIAAGSCATTREPAVRTVEVRVPVVQPCPDGRAPRPDFVDTAEAIRERAGKSDSLVALLLGGRAQRIAYQDASDAQIAACAGSAPALAVDPPP